MQVSDQCFDEWVRQHTRFLFGIAYWWTGSRSDAEEVVQETFFQAYRSRLSLRDQSVVKSWLVGIMRHCHSQMRRNDHAGLHVSLSEMVSDLPGKEKLPHDSIALHQLLGRLDDRHRLPLVLFYFEDLSYRAIADALEIPIGTVMSRIARAKKLLHDSLRSQQKLNVVPIREQK